jgi:pimeloyl-ACP methyl ester carboxylesterase
MLADWPADVAELLDRLDLGRVGMLGHSAGGAFALAVAHKLPERVTATVIFAGSGPYAQRWFRDAADMSRTSRFYYGMALRAPRMFGAIMQSSTPRTPSGIDRTLALVSRGDSPDAVFARTHPEQMRAALQATADGFRQGSAGTTAEARMICSPWGFAVEDVRSRIKWWHGEQDANVKPAAGRAMVARLPDAEPHFVDGGHSLLFERAPEVLASLRG